MKRFGILLLATALCGAATAREPVVPAAGRLSQRAQTTTDALAREAAGYFKDQQPGGVVLVTRGDQVHIPLPLELTVHVGARFPA
jgi:CubicO group peptidase (beta-lactamase class C family)